MSSTIKLTAKRQATFPVDVCEQLGLQPGDEIELIPRMEDGEQRWMLQKRGAPVRPWLGALRAYSGNVTEHSMDAVRDSITRGRKSES